MATRDLEQDFRNHFVSLVRNAVQSLEDAVSGNIDFVDEYGDDEYGEYDNYETAYGRLRKYFEDVPDVEFRVGTDMSYRGVIITLALGGPNIYLDTTTGEVRGYWGCDSFTVDVWRTTCDAIDDYWQEEFDMLRGC